MKHNKLSVQNETVHQNII